MPGLRVGAVSYLNTKPLIADLERLAPGIELVLDLPSRLADDLSAGRLDVALIPSVEAFRDPTYVVVSDACIGCRGPVRSVKLLSRRPMAEIRTLALDEGSRTSIALSRILLDVRHGVRPRLSSLPLGRPAEEAGTDAALVIGDRAMGPAPAEFPFVWDLGDVWCRWAELPFVFAMWTARPGVDLGELPRALSAARDVGLSRLEEIAAHEAPRVGLTPDDCLTYLRDHLHFRLGARERQGLELFRRLAAERGLVPPDPSVVARESSASGR